MAARSHDPIRLELDRVGRQNGIVTIAATIALPVIAALFSNFAEDLIAVNSAFFWSVIVIFVILQSALAFSLYKDRAGLFHYYVSHRESEDIARELGAALDRANAAILYSSTARSALRSSATTLGVSLRDNPGDREAIEEAIGDILDPIVDSADELFGFERDELWSFALYIPDRKQRVLMPIWRRKASGHPGSDQGRPWPFGVGHVGISYTTKRSAITPEIHDDRVIDAVRETGVHSRSYDEATYVSLASLPIHLVEDEEPFGVLAVTSNYPERLTKSSCVTLNELVPLLAILLQSVDINAVAAAIREPGPSAESKGEQCRNLTWTSAIAREVRKATTALSKTWP